MHQYSTSPCTRSLVLVHHLRVALGDGHTGVRWLFHLRPRAGRRNISRRGSTLPQPPLPKEQFVEEVQMETRPKEAERCHPDADEDLLQRLAEMPTTEKWQPKFGAGQQH